MKQLLILALLIFPFLKSFAQIGDPEKKAVIDSIVQKLAKKYSIVGLSIGIVNQDKKATHHFGHTDQSKKYPITDSTCFHLASVSKLFTATAILQLVERNQLKLEDKLVDLLPDFKMKDQRYKAISIEHLLTHTSGLPWDNKLKESPDDQSASQFYLQNLQNKKLNFSPGGKLSYKTYSNVAYDLLGILIEKVTGESFEQYIGENILHPLKMNQSTYFYESIDSSKLAIPQIVADDSKKIKRLNFQGIDHKRKPLLDGSPLALESYDVYGEDYEHNPSGNLIATAVELNQWIHHHLTLYSNRNVDGLLAPSTLQAMWSPQRRISNSTTSIGWGWWIREDAELGQTVFHVGNNPGFCSILMICPEQNFGIVVLCNGWYAQEAVWYQIGEAIAKLYVGKSKGQQRK